MISKYLDQGNINTKIFQLERHAETLNLGKKFKTEHLTVNRLDLAIIT